MKEVSIGTKRKSEVLESCLQEVKAVFLDVSHYVHDKRSMQYIINWILLWLIVYQ